MAFEEDVGPTDHHRPANPPPFNVPAVVLGAIVVFALLHAWRVYAFTDFEDERFVVDFAFIPGCYRENCADFLGRSPGALWWSPLTHAFLHGDWTHLALNTVWLLAFGTPVARRLRSPRFLGFCAAGALAGAAGFYVLNPDLIEPVIGASGIVSAVMGGACRFAFASLRTGRVGAAPEMPLLSVRQALQDRTVIFFVAIFFVSNVLTGVGLGSFLDGGAQVAWEAHVGGFLFGFLCFRAFDRRMEPTSIA